MLSDRLLWEKKATDYSCCCVPCWKTFEMTTWLGAVRSLARTSKWSLVIATPNRVGCHGAVISARDPVQWRVHPRKLGRLSAECHLTENNVCRRQGRVVPLSDRRQPGLSEWQWSRVRVRTIPRIWKSWSGVTRFDTIIMTRWIMQQTFAYFQSFRWYIYIAPF